MTLETVRAQVLTDDIVPVAVEGAVVRVFDELGTTFITQATTDVDGWADFTLDADDPPLVYQLRFFVVGGSFTSPQMIEAYSPAASSPTGTNDFAISAHMRTLPEAEDSRLCRVSGTVLGADGKPRAGVDVHFIHLFEPVVATPDVVLSERTVARSKRDGSFVIDLWRGSCYHATVESHENIQREVTVPDRAAVNLGDLLFPVVVEVTWDPAPPWILAVGDVLDITPTVTASNFQVLTGAASDDVEYTVSDLAVADAVVFGEDKVQIRGITSGTTELIVSRRDTSISRTPNAGITGSPASIVVS